jgi:hypothetical protein
MAGPDSLLEGSRDREGVKKVDVASSSRVGRDSLRESLEGEGIKKHENFYDVGQYETDSKEVRAMRDEKPDILVGSVDSTRFVEKWREPEWYRPYTDSAVVVSKCHSLLDDSTKKWFLKLKPVLDVFVGLRSLSDRDYKRRYKNEIFKIVKAKGSNSVYGTDGALNFLLAFNRIMDIYPDLKKALNKDFKVDELSVSEIKLSVGGGKGKEGGKSDRKAYMLVKKEEPTVSVPDRQPVPEPQVEIPEFGTPEFHKKYEITDAEEFKKALRPLDIWLSKDKLAEISDPKFWENLGVPASDQRRSNVKRLFEGKGGAISSLIVHFSTLSGEYTKFFADTENPLSKKYRDLFGLVMQRLFEYYRDENFDHAAIQLNVLMTLDSYIDNEDLNKEYRKSLIEKAISYVSDLKSFDSGRLDEWEALEVGYRAKLREI